MVRYNVDTASRRLRERRCFLDTTKTCSPSKILFVVAGSTYSDAEENLVAGIPWPAETTTGVLAVVRGVLLS